MPISALFLVGCNLGAELPLVLAAGTGGVDFVETPDHALRVLHRDGSTSMVHANGQVEPAEALGPHRRLSMDATGRVQVDGGGLLDVAPGCDHPGYGVSDRGIVRLGDRSPYGPVIDGLTGIDFADCDRMLVWGADSLLWVSPAGAELAAMVPSIQAAAEWEGEAWAVGADGWIYRDGVRQGRSGGPVNAVLFGHGYPLRAGSLYLLRDDSVDYVAGVSVPP